MFCQPETGTNFLTKVISRQQKRSLAGKEVNLKISNFIFLIEFPEGP